MEAVMTKDATKKRCAAALRAIKSLYGKPDGEFGPTLFVSHHLEEIEGAYWRRTVGVARPTPKQVLNALVLIKSWSSDENGNIDVFDFGLPDNASNYVLAVRFRDDGEVADVSMES
jgi:hypothetical protein